MTSKKTTRAASSSSPVDSIYDRITARIVAQLEEGALPWRKPWKASGNDRFSRPLRSCGKPYSGINVLVLWDAAESAGYRSPYWFTFNQAKELGACVRKGETATRVVYASTFTKKSKAESGETTEEKIPFLKEYCVFNADQIDGLPAKFIATAEPCEPVNNDARDDAAEAFLRHTGADIRFGGSSAYYTTGGDFIKLPEFETFHSCADFVATATHELVHWTGAKHRLAREFGKRFGDEAYAFEELIAELGAAFLCADLGFAPGEHCNHASYIAGWLKVLKEDKRAIFTAASQASRAAEYLHALQPSAEMVEPTADDCEPATA